MTEKEKKLAEAKQLLEEMTEEELEAFRQHLEKTKGAA